MSTLRDIANYSWEGMTWPQKVAVGGVVFITVALVIYLAVQWLTVSHEVRKLERQANTAKRDAETALKRAADIALEKLEAERKLAELQRTRDAKEKEANEAEIKTLDARNDYIRVLRERRTDSPTADQLCLELAAAGYPCL